MVVGDRVQYGINDEGQCMSGASKPSYVGLHAVVIVVSGNGRIFYIRFGDGTQHATTKSWLRYSSDGPW